MAAIYGARKSEMAEAGSEHLAEAINTLRSYAFDRMLVQRSRYDQAVKTAAALADSIKVAPANRTGAHLGPVVAEVQFNKIQTLIQAA